jgi:peptidoglycan-associated lipoprotein
MVALLISNTGCGKKVVPPPPAPKAEPTPPPEPPKPPAPKISLKVTPAAIEKGQSATLTWASENVDKVIIDNGIGTVEASGSRTIQPTVSTTYIAKVSNVSGNASAEIRLTVTVPAPVIPPPPPPPAITDAAFFEANIKDAFFDFDQYTVRDEARQVLTANARALAERPGIRVSVEGYCDERGSEKYNLVLGDKRANAVKDFLVSLGVDASRIDTISYGEEKNFCEEHNEECWQKNRRGHFVMR